MFSIGTDPSILFALMIAEASGGHNIKAVVNITGDTDDESRCNMSIGYMLYKGEPAWIKGRAESR